MLEATRRQYLLAGRTGIDLEHTLDQLARLTRWIYEHGLTPEQAFNCEPELRSLQSESFVEDRVYGRSARFFQQLREQDVAAAWRTVECPVLALHGNSDWLAFAEHSARVAELAPLGRWQELTGIDHMMHARATLEEAFAEPFSGVFDPKALDALVAFYCEHLESCQF
jgi:pimeloyl-ACP methyl ester carboxylesterase